MDLHLLIHNIASIASGVVGLCLVFFILINNPRSASALSFVAVLFSGVIFILSHVIGVNISDPDLSRDVLMFNLVVFLLPVFTLHAVFALTGKTQECKGMLLFLYIVSSCCIVFFIFFPDLFLLPSVPKMYFPNYYNPGLLNWTRVAFTYVVVIPYALYEITLAFAASNIAAERNRLKYFFITIVGGYAIGFIPNFLVYNVPIDPLWGVWFFFITGLPLLYGAVAYELFDIKVVAKQAFAYTIGIIVIGGMISVVDFVNQKIRITYPFFPEWIAPLASAIVVVSAAFVIWRKLRESDILKSEFITVVTHKFRTPLTQIRWGTENLSQNLPPADKEIIDEIRQSNYHLIDLTNLLVQLSDTDTVDFNYHLKPQKIDEVLETLKADYNHRASLKNISISFNGSSQHNIMIDQVQIHFVLQTLLDNALSYTPEGGTVRVEIAEEKSSSARNSFVVLRVTDNGIGLSKEDSSRLFQKFWRSKSALKADTEGMGIGLFMSQRIVKRHNGSLKAESEGLGKGTVFTLKFPFAS